jgi:hypothetical protein
MKQHLKLTSDGNIRKELSTVYLRIPSSLKRRLDRHVVKLGISLNFFVGSCVEGYMNERGL